MAFQNITVECHGCGASISVDPTIRFGTCPYCGNCNSLVPAATAPEPPAVEQIYPANSSEEAFRNAVRSFLCSSPDVPDELYAALSEREFTLNFWPFFRHTIQWTASWNADIGYPDDNAKEGVAWSPGSGQAMGQSAVYAPASSVLCNRGLAADACKLSAGIQTQPYYFQPELLNGIAYLGCDVEANAVEDNYAVPTLNDMIENSCIDQLPGDYQKNLHFTSRIEARETVLQLIPYWLFVYEYQGGCYYVMQNAVTGAVTGSLPETSRRKMIGWALTGTALVLIGLFAGLMGLIRSNYDALMVAALSFPTLCAGFLYREIITRKKTRIKTVSLAEMPEQLENLNKFEKNFIKFTGLAVAGWCIAAMFFTFFLALVIPVWKDPILKDIPEEPKYPQTVQVSNDAQQPGPKPSVIRLKRTKIPAIQETVDSEDGISFIIEK
ncbi:MAG: hypothetical protein E7058_08350 [Lentisphaerae bacterium]|nr:hypothetical protein [Lentisphaerota bacterium]